MGIEIIKEELEAAFNIISKIPVSGDGVELMAAAKERLRAAFKECSKERENGG